MITRAAPDRARHWRPRPETRIEAAAELRAAPREGRNGAPPPPKTGAGASARVSGAMRADQSLYLAWKVPTKELFPPETGAVTPKVPAASVGTRAPPRFGSGSPWLPKNWPPQSPS